MGVVVCLILSYVWIWLYYNRFFWLVHDYSDFLDLAMCYCGLAVIVIYSPDCGFIYDFPDTNHVTLLSALDFKDGGNRGLDYKARNRYFQKRTLKIIKIFACLKWCPLIVLVCGLVFV